MKSDETVVLLHGIGQSKHNMLLVERFLRKRGRRVLNIGYPSTKKPLSLLAKDLEAALRTAGVMDQTGPVHFVTHSMGGLVLRAFLDSVRARKPAFEPGRVVMVAPPNRGSEVADFLEPFAPYHWFYGPAGRELTTALRERDIEQPWYQLGVIAGRTSWPYPIARFFFDGPNDGRVSVARTRIPGLADHLVVNATHTFITWKPAVHRQIEHFLEYGRFNHGQTA